VRSVEIDMLVSALGGFLGKNPGTMLERTKSMMGGVETLFEVVDAINEASRTGVGGEKSLPTGGESSYVWETIDRTGNKDQPHSTVTARFKTETSVITKKDSLDHLGIKKRVSTDIQSE
jgi:hypothetical protein